MRTKKRQYSEMEQKVLDNIPKDGSKISSVELTNLCYDTRTRPPNARVSIVTTANRLIEKSDDNEEEWEIHRSAKKGSQPAYFWIKKREVRK